MKRIGPGLALLFIAPVLGELVSGHQPPLTFFNPIVFLVLALPYGCGALLCREFTRRWDKGWLGLLLLSCAYALYEEGIVSRALFDPDWRELGTLSGYGHFAGINWTYGFVLIHFHVAVSIGASVLLAELLYPERRHERWLTGWQASLCALVLIAWAPVLALLARSDEPLFVPSALLWVLTGVMIVVLVTAARFVSTKSSPPVQRHPPRPWRFLVLGAVNMSVAFVTVFMLPEEGVLIPAALVVLFLVAVDGVALLLLLRWSGGGHAWGDRQRLALAAGVLFFFMLFGVLSDLEKFEGKSLVSLVAVVGLVWVGRRIKTAAPGQRPPNGHTIDHGPRTS